jgi:hypothetical protein
VVAAAIAAGLIIGGVVLLVIARLLFWTRPTSTA